MEFVKLAIEDHIATITLNNPPVNVSTPALVDELTEVLDSFRSDRDVRVSILTGGGDRAFMAGADLKSAPPSRREMRPADLLDRGRGIRELFWAVYDCAVPVIAAVNGPAIGAGLALAAVCDVIIASEKAFFQAAEINVGLLGASAQLSLLVGRHKARELFFTGRPISAAELERWGAVSQVTSPGELMSCAQSLAAELASKSPIALRLAKESMNRVEFVPLKEAYRLEQDYTVRLLGFDDAAEARAAWQERRSPTWGWT
jgi:enoyl-CoA hydratase